MTKRYEEINEAQVWLTEGSYNRGWAFNEITNEKIRITQADFDARIAYQNMKLEQEAAEAEKEEYIAEMMAKPVVFIEDHDMKLTVTDQEDGGKVIDLGVTEGKIPTDALDIDMDVPVIDAKTGDWWEIEEGVKGTVFPSEVGATDRLKVHIATEATVKGAVPKMIVIECQDCGESRLIKVQDQFQVTRCKECQRKHRNAKRRQKRAEKKAQA